MGKIKKETEELQELHERKEEEEKEVKATEALEPEKEDISFAVEAKGVSESVEFRVGSATSGVIVNDTQTIIRN